MLLYAIFMRAHGLNVKKYQEKKTESIDQVMKIYFH